MRKTLRRCMKKDMTKWIIAITKVLAITFCIGTGAVYADTDNGDGTMTDGRGLVWLKNANCFGRQRWDQAMSIVSNLHDGQCGLTDGSTAGQWRLPTKYELMSRASNISRFDNFLKNGYWSSTIYADETESAWIVYVYRGFADYRYKICSYYLWPIRSGQ